jgi:uncharacterized protein (DUF1684 family)
VIDPERHRAEVEEWREKRYRSLRRDTGWLTLAGLGWLKPGENRVGSDPSADVVLPAGPPTAGEITVTGGRATATGAWRHEGRAAHDLPLVTDRDGEPTLLALGALRLCLIERGDRLAVRTWDLDAPARTAFDGIEHWPVDPAWRLEAHLESTPNRTLEVPDVFGGTEREESPGDLVFETASATHRLQALPGGDGGELWLIFGDATNGGDSYGGGRYLYTDPPEAVDRYVVDFNRAYNPPCVFTPHATCGLPWPANRLPIRIEAGEKRYGDGH